MADRRPIQTFLEGTAIKIWITLSVATATSVTIKIVDPGNTTKVNNANMLKEVDKVYSYVYQSISGDITGTYIVTFTIVYNTYTTVYQDKFMLAEQEPV
jgi:hypothetical protein